jgi:hypothetical protein
VTREGVEPRRKAKRSKRREEPREPERQAPPPFARDYPAHPELDRLVGAFTQGNYAAVRTGAEALATRSKDEAVQHAARDLRRRLDPEPTAIYLWGLGVGLSILLYVYYVMHAH